MSFTALMHKLLALTNSDELNQSHPLGHELDKATEAHPEEFSGFVHSLGSWAKEHSETILHVIHKLRPVLTVKNISIVTSYEAVKDVLGRDGDFSVTYGKKMKMITQGKGFFLGVDDDDIKGFSDRNNMQMLFRRDDIETYVKPKIKVLCKAQLEKQAEQFDLVSDYLQCVPAKFAIDYFGLQKTDPNWLLKITKTLFEYLFIDIVNDPELEKQAEKAAKELRNHLDQVIAKSNENTETIIGRGIKLDQAGILGFDAVNLRNNIIGLLIGLVPTIGKSAAMAFDLATQDLKSSNELHTAFFQRTESSFQTYVRELTRLNPINPGLFRKATADTYISSGGDLYNVKKDGLIFVSTYTAMRDEKHVEDPLTIKLHRPDSAYLTYGYGLHACFGRYVNDFHVSQLIESLYIHKKIKRLEGNEGNLQFVGVFPAHLKVNTQV